ncbi:MAG: C40 family peptidase [Prevotella sp.]|jgi:cell wall-associated NlpC family hydrolase|nr:C40 family peptidase [Prevotella sp.]
MFISKQIYRITSFLLVCLIAFTPISAITPRKSKTGKKKPKTSVAHSSKSVKVVKASENVAMATDTGKKVLLPKYDKIVEEHYYDIPSSEIFLADAGSNVARSMEAIKGRVLAQKEMQELSSLLGISITNPDYLDLYREAADWLGTRYRRGGMSRAAVDCSGFTNIIYKNVYGQQLDRVSTTIAKNVKESITDKADLLPGDMVFFSTFKKKHINHVGVYIGDGKFIHASIKQGVIVSSLSEGYYSKAWRKGGRN